jgi:hydrogenase nickel incorporation protein HypB
MEIEVFEGIYESNERVAEENRKTFQGKGVYVVNLMASPGAGKTSLVMGTIRALKEQLRMGVIEGDIASRIDADKLKELQVPVVQINTGGACHLDANMIRKALPHIDLESLDLLIVENVGNLVCPAEFRLGEDLKVMILSVAEGDDKPLKYPLMFSQADVLVVNKIDLLGLSDFDLGRLRDTVKRMNADIEIFEMSCRTGQGLEAWTGFLLEKVLTSSK